MSDEYQTWPEFIGSFALRSVGFFVNAYIYFGVNVINLILSKLWDPFYETHVSEVSLAIFAGAVTGQLVLGSLADQLGRKKIMLVAAGFQIVGTIAAAGALGPTRQSELGFLAFYLAVLGFGIGAEYPLSATSSAENTQDPDDRAPVVAAVFSLQGIGAVVAALVGTILIVALVPGHEPYPKTQLNIAWRLMFGLAVIPVAIAFPFKWRMEESRDYLDTSNVGEDRGLLGSVDDNAGVVTGNDQPAGNDAVANRISNLSLTDKLGIIWRHYRGVLFGTAVPWFLFDVVFYAQAIFSAIVVSRVGVGDNLVTIAVKNLCVVIGALPGYYVALYFINKLGRRRMQLQGFFFMGVIFFIMYFGWTQIVKNAPLFIILYGSTFFFANFGPNTSTFILPVELFPTQIRSTCHGISSASAKIGAAVGVGMFAPMQKAYGTQAPFIVCGIVAWVGLFVTFFFIPVETKLPEQLDEEFRMIVQEEMRKTEDDL